MVYEIYSPFYSGCPILNGKLKGKGEASLNNKHKAPALLRLLRPKQWLKNGFVLLPLLFSGFLLKLDLVEYALLATLVFCLLSGCVYIFNDIVDRESDRKHLAKRDRPIASGEVSIASAARLLAILLVIAFVCSFFVGLLFIVVAVSYFALNIAYSLALKHIPAVDILCVSMGFVLRVVGGAIAISCFISPWILFCTFSLSLFLAIQKRYGEIDESEGLERGSRKVLGFYTRELLNELGSIAASLTIVAYSLYTFNATQTEWMMITIPFVVFGLFRYLIIAKTIGGVESPEKILLQDKAILVDVALWIAVCAVLLYVL